jgi:hypothetical protein
MPTQTEELQTIQRPDGKYQQFKKSWTQDRIDKYFTKQGWVKDKSGKWLTASGEEPKKGIVGGIPKSAGKIAEEKAQDKAHQNLLSAVDYGSKSLPSAMGTGFSLAAGSKKTPTGMGMAAVGGMAGEAANDIIQRFVFGRAASGIPTGGQGDTNYNQIKDILWEGVKQGGLEFAGRKGGEIFFNLLNKIPHATIRQGIKLLPSEMSGGKISRYIEDLLGNLPFSSKIMADFKLQQSEEIIKKIDSFSQGMARFTGTSEEMGGLVKDAIKAGEKSAKKAVDITKAAYMKKGMTEAQANANLAKTNLYKNYVKDYKNYLAQAIINERKPEAIAGLFTSNSFSHEEVRTMCRTLQEISPENLGRVQNRIMRDMLSETVTKFKDPVAKGTKGIERKFGGDHWVDTLNKYGGEERLKAIYGVQGYKNIEDFTKLVGTIGRNVQGSMIGKFLTLSLIMTPIRAGLSPKVIGKTAITGLVLNRAARMITSTEGVEITNKFARATITNSPRLINLAREEWNKFNERSDAEYQKDELEGEQEYMAEHNKNKEKK